MYARKYIFKQREFNIDESKRKTWVHEDVVECILALTCTVEQADGARCD